MMTARSLLVRLRSLWRRDAVESELDEELRYHLERETERLTARGIDPDTARLAAGRSLGNIGWLKEESRAARGLPRLEAFLGDLRSGLRLIPRQPGFAAVVILSLALGLGVTTAVFNLTYNVLLAPLALPHPEQLAALLRVGEAGADNMFSMREYGTLRELTGVGTFGVMRTASQIAVAAGPTREYVNMHFVDGEFFSTLGLEPSQGRLLTPKDDEEQATVAVLAQSLAERLFPEGSILGRSITIREVPYTVVGVTPRSFRGLEFPGQFTVAIPLSTVPLLAGAGPREDDRGVPLSLGPEGNDRRVLSIVARLRIPPKPAGEALNTRFSECCAAISGTGPERVDLLEISRGIGGQKDDFRGTLGTILLIALVGMGVVAAIVCSNIASLLLVRTAARERELAVRLSLGASRGRVVTQLLLETLPLALIGGALGLVVAWWAAAALIRQVPEWESYIDLVRFRPGLQVLGFMLGAALLSGISFALFPALRATGGNWAPALRLDGRATGTRRQGRAAAGVVVGQVALSVVVVTAATLFIVTLRNLTRVDGGFASDRVLLLRLDTRGTSYEERGAAPLAQQILDEVRLLPGVQSATISSMVPLFGGSMWETEIGGPGITQQQDQRTWVQVNAVVPGYLTTLGIPLLKGRDLTAADGESGGPVAIVSQAFGQRYFGAVDPVGRSFGLGLGGDSLTQVRVVGVARDARYHNLRQTPGPMVYLPLSTGDKWSSLSIVVRTHDDPLAIAPGARYAVEKAAAGVRIRRISEMGTQLREATAIERLAAELAGFASLMAIVLAMMGLYGLVAYGVARRTRELGIRRALGAQSGAIVRLVAGDLAGIVAAGVGLGLGLSVVTTQAIRSQLFGVGAHDPIVILGSVGLLVVAVALAAAAPAIRALRIHPRIALIAE